MMMMMNPTNVWRWARVLAHVLPLKNNPKNWAVLLKANPLSARAWAWPWARALSRPICVFFSGGPTHRKYKSRPYPWCLFLLLLFTSQWQWDNFMNNGSGNHNTCQKRWWDLWCRENGSLLLKWKGYWASVGLQRENDTNDSSAWLPRSIVDCQSMRSKMLQASFSKVWRQMMWPKAVSRNGPWLNLRAWPTTVLSSWVTKYAFRECVVVAVFL